MRVHALGKKLVEVLEKSGKVPMVVYDAGVMMIAHRHRKQHVDLILLSRHCQAINERLISDCVRSHQKLPLSTTTSQKIALAW